MYNNRYENIFCYIQDIFLTTSGMGDGDPGREEVMEAGSSKWSKYRNTLSFISRSRAARREAGEAEDSGEDITKQE